MGRDPATREEAEEWWEEVSLAEGLISPGDEGLSTLLDGGRTKKEED
jgi:hypothetical protein